MMASRPLSLRKGTPATDILGANGRVLATVYPHLNETRGMHNATVIRRSYEDAEATAAELVRAYNERPVLVAGSQARRRASASSTKTSIASPPPSFK